MADGLLAATTDTAAPFSFFGGWRLLLSIALEEEGEEEEFIQNRTRAGRDS